MNKAEIYQYLSEKNIPYTATVWLSADTLMELIREHGNTAEFISVED